MRLAEVGLAVAGKGGLARAGWRGKAHRVLAIERMRRAGAFITTHEAVLFELLRDAKHPNFKEVSGLIKTQVPPTDLA